MTVFMIIYLMITTCLNGNTFVVDAAITSRPQDLEECIYTSFTINWDYSDKSDLSRVEWKRSSSLVVVQNAPGAPQVQPGYDTFRYISDGKIENLNASWSDNTTFSVDVSYSLSSGLSSDTDSVFVYILDPPIKPKAVCSGPSLSGSCTCSTLYAGSPAVDVFIKVGSDPKVGPTSTVETKEDAYCCVRGDAVKCMANALGNTELCWKFREGQSGLGQCDLKKCWIVAAVNICLITVLVVVHIFFIQCRVQNCIIFELSCKHYGLRALLPGGFLFVVSLIVHIVVFFKELQDLCAIFKCFILPLIVMLLVDVIGLVVIAVYVHFRGKKVRSKDEIAGSENTELDHNKAGEESGAACFGGRVIPVCGEPDSQSVNKRRPLPTGADKSHPHVETKTEKGKHEKTGSAVSGGDIQLQQVNKDGDVLKPRKLPGIPGKERETRGLSANFEEDIMDKKRLTPIGQDATEVYEETPRKKKKKKKAKEEEKED